MSAALPLEAIGSAQILTPHFRACRDARRFFMGEEIRLDEGLYSEGNAAINRFYSEHQAYYPHRGEVVLLRDKSDSIVPRIKDTECLRVIGPGPVGGTGDGAISLANKELHLIDRLPHLKQVDIVDVSGQIAGDNVSFLRDHFARSGRNVRVTEVVSDYRRACPSVTDMPNTTVICLGGLVANVSGVQNDKFPEEKIRESLRALRDLAGSGPGAKVVLGYDANQDARQIEQSYNHPAIPEFMLGGIRWLAKNCPNMSGLDPDQVEQFFEYAPAWQEQASTYRHNVRVIKPLPLHFSAMGAAPAESIVLLPGMTRNTLNSVKPQGYVMDRLGAEVGLKTDIRIQDGNSQTEHIFDVVQAPTP